MAPPSNIEALIGRWQVVEWVQQYRDGRRIHPMGHAPTGFVEYSPQGTMAVMIALADRTPFASGAQWGGTLEERARAYDTMLAYAGRYQVVGDTILHHVEFSLFPNWVGGVQRRRFVLCGDELDLSMTLEAGTPEERDVHIRWQRWPNVAGDAPAATR